MNPPMQTAPAAGRDLRPVAGAAVASARRPGLLLVEADPLVRQAMEQIFQNDFAVSACDSGAAALEFLGQARHDVVIVDGHLPGMSGWELAQRVHHLQPEAQTILLGTDPSLDLTTRTAHDEIFAALRKPFEVSVLRELVLQASARAEVRREEREHQALLEQQAHQAESFRMERDIYAGALHDLNGSLTVISSLAETLSLELSQTLTGVRMANQQFQELLLDLRHQSLMAIEISRRSMRLLRRNQDQDRCDAKAVLEDLGHLLRSHRSAKGHQLRVQPPLAPVLLQASAADVFRMISNLGLNALQASGRPHRVDIECWTVRDALPAVTPTTGGGLSFWLRDNFLNQPPFVAIAVRDDGPGVPADLVPRLFRESLTTKPSGEGTGLGLPVVYRAVLETRAALHFTTVPGRGTCVTLYLPA